MTSPDAAEPRPTPDFTVPREPHTFKIDGEEFKAPAILSPITLRKLAVQASKLDELGSLSAMTDVASILAAIDALSDAMRTLMPGTYGQRFAERLNSEGGEAEEGQPAPVPPIDLMKQAMPAFFYLLECYGLRPTVPSSPLPAGSTDGSINTPSDGTPSTDGASQTDLDPAQAPSTPPIG